MRGRSYSRSPPRRGYGRRRRSPSPRRRYRGYDRDAPTSLLVRNLRLDCRPEDLRRPFSEFGPLKDIYLPRDYYTGEPRGFGFVQFVDPADAADAKYQMDRQVFQGRELTVVFAEENRKKPLEMRSRERSSWNLVKVPRVVVVHGGLVVDATEKRVHDGVILMTEDALLLDIPVLDHHPVDMQDLGPVVVTMTLRERKGNTHGLVLRRIKGPVEKDLIHEKAEKDHTPVLLRPITQEAGAEVLPGAKAGIEVLLGAKAGAKV
ncbi:hypothetical protein KSS87_011110 [Heliosperma pusillum]|nr:hypothetical protein KSS87_011110 [Heliosperma pusillum]